MTFACDKCRDTGKRVLHVADDGAVTHSEYLDCHHCDAASEIATRSAASASAPQAVADAELLQALDRMIYWFKGYPEIIPKPELTDKVYEDIRFAKRISARRNAAALASSPVAQQPKLNLDDATMLDVVKAYVAAGKRGCDLIGALKCAIEAAAPSTASPSNPKEQGNG